MKIIQKLFILILLFVQTVYASDYLVTDFGASPTAKVNTIAIQKAIDKCNAEGGGRVIIPNGSFTTGTLILKSNVELHLFRGAFLKGSKEIKDYTDIRTDFISFRTTGQMSQLLYAENATNIAITGFGTIDGCGREFPHVQGAIDEGITRPHVLQFIKCKGVLIKDVTMMNSPCWMQHYLACENLRIQDINVYNHNNYNNDAIDVDACKNVIISGCNLDSDDDGITFKGTCDLPCENVVVTNCVVSSHCNAIKMGTETNGGFVNFTISNCVIKPSKENKHTFFGKVDGNGGIALEIVDGGHLNGITIDNVTIEGTVVPFFIRLGNRGRAYHKLQKEVPIGSIENVLINNINARGSKMIGCSITGIPGASVKNVRISNFVVEQTGGSGRNIIFSDIPEHIKKYPEGYMFGTLPAYGFYIRHVENVTLDNVETRYVQMDARPAFFLDDVKDGVISNSSIMSGEKSEGNIIVKESKNISVFNNVVKGYSEVFAKVIDNKSKNIAIRNNFLPGKCMETITLNPKTMYVTKWNIRENKPSISSIKDMFENSNIPFTNIDYIWENYPTNTKASVRTSYSDEEIFIQYKIKENCIKAVCDNDTIGMPCNDSCVEFFVRETKDKPYYNFELNCIGATLFEEGFSRRDRKRHGKDVTSLIRRESTLGKVPFNEKKGEFEWEITMAIPLSLFLKEHSNMKGKEVSANFFKCLSQASEPHWLSWNPILISSPAFHEPHFFGRLIFN